jgi:hypothetical protein
MQRLRGSNNRVDFANDFGEVRFAFIILHPARPSSKLIVNSEYF